MSAWPASHLPPADLQDVEEVLLLLWAGLPGQPGACGRAAPLGCMFRASRRKVLEPAVGASTPSHREHITGTLMSTLSMAAPCLWDPRDQHGEPVAPRFRGAWTPSCPPPA